MSKESYLTSKHKVLLYKAQREDFQIAAALEKMYFGEQDRKCANCREFLIGRCAGEELETQKEIDVCMLASAVRKRLFFI